MTKRKNLSKEDIDDVSTFESSKPSSLTNKISIQNLPIHVKCLNEKQKELKKSIEEKDVTIAIGPAGGGKTYITLLTALHLLKTQQIYDKLILIKSLQVINGEGIGYLPGTIDDKITPYMYSYIGNIDKIFNSTAITKSLIEQNIIQFFPIAFIRGMTFDNCIICIDEIENLTFHAFKSIITRIGKNCKMIFLGDDEQSDLKNPEDSCIKKSCNLLKNNQYVKIIEFNNDELENVRNPIIKYILKDLNK